MKASRDPVQFAGILLLLADGGYSCCPGNHKSSRVECSRVESAVVASCRVELAVVASCRVESAVVSSCHRVT